MKNKNIYPWVVVALLWVVALLNYMDRQMLSTMQEAMKIDIGHERYVLDTTENIISHILTGYERDKVNLKKGY